MSIKLFTPEEIAEFRKSPYVASVTERKIEFTPEFKKKCYEEYLKGRTMKDILEEHGINTAAMGRARYGGMIVKLRKQADRTEGFTNLRLEKPEKPQETAEMKLERRVRQLEHQLAYAQQEVEFLKKLQQANLEAQKQWESRQRRK